jgi:hypothetical protein
MRSGTSSRTVSWTRCARRRNPTAQDTVAKRKPWVLDSGTKGTGAEMVPLEKVLRKPRPDREPFVPPKPRPRTAAAAPQRRQPRRFKVVDVASARVLAEDADARDAIRVLESVRSVVDVRVYVWQPRAKRWRLLTMAEQRALWDRRPN